MNPSECLAKAAGEAVLLKDMFEILCARGGKKNSLYSHWPTLLFALGSKISLSGATTLCNHDI